MPLNQYARAFLHLWFPELCLSCRKALMPGEQAICYYCITSLPRTFYHNQINNPMAQRFWGRVPIQQAAAFLYFRRTGITQHLLHQLKYHGREAIGRQLGILYGYDLLSAQSVFKSIDAIVPIPLHWKRLRERGYNQCDAFGEGLAETIGCPFYPDALMRTEERDSQTGYNRYQRWENVSGVFKVAYPEKVNHKHILLIDDTMTTGATLEAGATALLSCPGLSVSLATIATAGLGV